MPDTSPPTIFVLFRFYVFFFLTAFSSLFQSSPFTFSLFVPLSSSSSFLFLPPIHSSLFPSPFLSLPPLHSSLFPLCINCFKPTLLNKHSSLSFLLQCISLPSFVPIPHIPHYPKIFNYLVKGWYVLPYTK